MCATGCIKGDEKVGLQLETGLLRYYREAGRLLNSHVLVLVLRAAKVPLCCRKQWQLFVNQYLIRNKTSLPCAENSMNPVLYRAFLLNTSFFI